MALNDLQTLRYEVSEGIATITLHRPEKLNAFTAQMRDELIAAFDETDADDAVRAVVITGNGRAFCAGADLAAGGDTFVTETSGEVPPDIGGRTTLRIFRSTKPVVAAINGPAAGVGVTMTLPADIRIAWRQLNSVSSSPRADSSRRRARAGSCRDWSVSAPPWSG